MTVSSTTNKVSYSGNGTNDTFAYTFKIFADADLKVFIRDSSGTETLKTITTHYTVTNAGVSTGGNVVFTSGNIPSATDTVVIQRSLTLTQGTDYVENDPFPAQSHEDALDRLTFVTQQIQEEVDRSIKASVTNTIAGAEFALSASDRANKVFAFDGSGDLSVTQELGTFRGNWAASTDYSVRDLVKDTSTNNIFIVNTAHTSSGAQPLTTNANSAKYDLIVDAASATTSATNAAASATTATTKASEASTSASNASTSETNAATSETNASTSETNAASSATAAAASATAASTSETNASTSATAAASSATAAAASETAASASETAAAASESAAATSETNASTSATTATTKASEASTSATNAATSASNASTSETNSASSATAAAASAASAAASFDAFDDIYLGAKASAPTQDNDGDALTEGDQYFNTTNNTLFVWNGSAWQAASPDIVGDTTPQLGGNLDTNGNDINFGDNDKAIFGAGSDLQIYHDVSASYVSEQGTGNLKILGTNLELKNAADNANYMVASNGGSVQLYNNGAKKFETKSDGVDITGELQADSLDIDGTANFSTSSTGDLVTLVSTATNASAGPNLVLHRNSSSPAVNDVTGKVVFQGEEGTSGDTIPYSQIQSMIEDPANTAADGRLDLMTTRAGTLRSMYTIKSTESVVNEDSVNVDFRVESDSNTHALFVDAGNDRIGLGESSPAQKVHISDTGTAGSVRLRLENSEGFGEVSTDSNAIQLRNAGGIVFEGIDNSYTAIRDGNNTERLRVNTGETVINESSADYDFRVESNGFTHGLYLDAAEGLVGVFNDGSDTSPAGGTLTTTLIESVVGRGQLRVGNNQTTSTGVGELRLMGYGSANNKGGGHIYFDNTRWNGTNSQLGAITCMRDGTYAGAMNFYTGNQGYTKYLTLHADNTESVFNEDSNDIDFRVESNDNTHALFVDGGNNKVGIVDSTPVDSLTIGSGNMRFKGTGSRVMLLNSTDAYNLGSSGGSAMHLFQASSGHQGVAFEVHDTGVHHREAMRIQPEGNVTVGPQASSGVTNSTHEIEARGSGDMFIAVAGGSFGSDEQGFVLRRNGSYGSMILTTAGYSQRYYSFNEFDQFQWVKWDGSTETALMRLNMSGQLIIKSTYVSNGSPDYAEYFEWADGNTSNENRKGETVVLVDGKVRIATSSDAPADIIGVVSRTAGVILDSGEEEWTQRYLTDDYGEIQTHSEQFVRYTSESEGGERDRPVGTEALPSDAQNVEYYNEDVKTENPDYDPDREYTSRRERQEWDPIGLMGKLRITKGRPVNPNWIKMRDISATVEEWLVR